MEYRNDLSRDFIRVIRLLLVAVAASVALSASLIFWASNFWSGRPPVPANIIASEPAAAEPRYWQPPDIRSVADKAKAEEILYGKELIAHTAKYLGPEGTVLKMSNGMNCQNCHLDAGTKIFGNNYGAVASTYPKFRARSGAVESVQKRVNDCFERSLNGRSLDTASREMHAIVSYLEWLGAGVKKGDSPEGSGLIALEPLTRAADPARGKAAYEVQCVACHGPGGEGMKTADGKEYQFPPLWGKNSYNHGAGLFRVSTFARYVYANMPLGATYSNPLLTGEQAWDIAAYVNSLPRPAKDLSGDWPDISKKPVDHPFGPYADSFNESQHKFGPWQPIQQFYAAKKPE